MLRMRRELASLGRRDDAMLASERADQLLGEGDMAGAETWHRILNAVERLQATKPTRGRRCIRRGRAVRLN
jgi:hypothetical protein